MHINDFKETQIIMVSPNPVTYIEEFNQQYHLNTYEQITILWDKEKIFPKIFGKAPFPSSLVYDANHNFVKKFPGQVEIEILSNYFN
jgi:hypothetical protein